MFSLITNDPLANKTDLCAFKSPANPNKIAIIANYIPGQLSNGGPNYYSFGENVRYEIHIDNNVNTKGDDIIYRLKIPGQPCSAGVNGSFSIRKSMLKAWIVYSSFDDSV